MLVYYVTNFEIAKHILVKSGTIEAKTPIEPRGKVIRMYQQTPPPTFKKYAIPSEGSAKAAADFVTKADNVDVYMEFVSDEVDARRRKRGEWVAHAPIRVFAPAAREGGQPLLRAVYA